MATINKKLLKTLKSTAALAIISIAKTGGEKTG